MNVHARVRVASVWSRRVIRVCERCSQPMLRNSIGNVHEDKRWSERHFESFSSFFEISIDLYSVSRNTEIRNLFFLIAILHILLIKRLSTIPNNFDYRKQSTFSHFM